MASTQEDIFGEIQGFVEAVAAGRDVLDKIAGIEQLILSSEEAEDFYIKYVFGTVSLIRKSQAASGPETASRTGGEELAPTHRLLRPLTDVNLAAADDEEASEYDALRHSAAMILPALRESEAEQDEPASIFGGGATGKGEAPVPSRKLRRAAMAALVLLAVGITAALLHRHSPVATLTQAAGATWEDGSSREIRSQLKPGDQLGLTNGCCSLKFADGTAVILEGPAHFTVQSRNEIWLRDGKLTAAMSGGAKGFVVHSPLSVITDMGTEFGVSVDRSNGNTEVDVFKGSVRINATAQQPSAPAADLVAGDMATVENNALHIDRGGSVPQKYVRDINGGPLSLDVADLMAGGDGTTHRRGFTIDPATGNTGAIPPAAEIASDMQYHRLSVLPVIDGCFIPNGVNGPVQIDSAGDRYGLPATDSQSYDMIASGNQIPFPPGVSISTTLSGVDYSKPEHWLLYLHANVGLTFDLSALRRLHPGSTLQQFHATVGNVYSGSAGPTRAAILYIVDGQVRFQRAFDQSEVFTAAVPLGESDQFLSIVTLEAGPGGSLRKDVMLGDAAFEMDAVK